MKRVLFGIFAHPDDESFGPSGTLLKMARGGVDVHLICLTRGEAGINIDNYTQLATVRQKEWQAAGKLIGATSMKQFDFGDGKLNNELYHTVAKAVKSHITTVLAAYKTPVAVEFMTFDTTGVTGHLDHIAASLISSYLFLQLQKNQQPHTFTRLRYFCLPPNPLDNDTSFVYWPGGRPLETIDEIIDVNDVFDQKTAIMQTHTSQRQDMELWLQKLSDVVKYEHFQFLR